MGQVEFKDFLWEALLDPCPGVTMGDSAETLAKRYKISREEADQFCGREFQPCDRRPNELLPERRNCSRRE